MNSNVKIFSVFLLLVVCAASFSGCSKLFGPSDEEVIGAIKENKYYKNGIGTFTFEASIVILEKGSRNKDGSWPVKVKVFLNKKQNSAPVELTPTFNMYKTKDNEGKITWKAELG